MRMGSVRVSESGLVAREGLRGQRGDDVRSGAEDNTHVGLWRNGSDVSGVVC